MKLHGLRDYAAYEVAHHNLKIPLVFTSFNFRAVSITNSRTININRLRRHQNEVPMQTNKRKSNSLIYENIMDHYSRRSESKLTVSISMYFFI